MRKEAAAAAAEEEEEEEEKKKKKEEEEGIQVKIPPASKTRYLSPGPKLLVSVQESRAPPLMSCTGTYRQNNEAASGSKAIDNRSVMIPA